jgi:IS30 family transposase
VPISASLPMFEHTAREIAEEMGRDPSPAAQDIARRARELAETFRSWGAHEPPENIRKQAIQKVLDLHREAQEQQARRT